MNRRKTLVALIELAAVPLGAAAQQAGRIYRIGWLSPTAAAFPDETGLVASYARPGANVTGMS